MIRYSCSLATACQCTFRRPQIKWSIIKGVNHKHRRIQSIVAGRQISTPSIRRRLTFLEPNKPFRLTSPGAPQPLAREFHSRWAAFAMNERYATDAALWPKFGFAPDKAVDWKTEVLLKNKNFIRGNFSESRIGIEVSCQSQVPRKREGKIPGSQ